MFGWSPIPWKLVSYVLAAAIAFGVLGGWLARIGYDRGVAARDKALLPKIERLTTDLARCEATGDQWEAASQDWKAAVTDMDLVKKRKDQELRQARREADRRIRTLETASASLRAHVTKVPGSLALSGMYRQSSSRIGAAWCALATLSEVGEYATAGTFAALRSWSRECPDAFFSTRMLSGRRPLRDLSSGEVP